MRIVDQQFSLKNDGQLWIYFLGCGSAFSRRHNQTNLLIVKGDRHLLVDCGTTCGRALARAGLSVLDIDDVLITHSHADHVGGLEELILMNRYVARRRPRIYIPGSYQKTLWNQTLRGGAEYNERHNGKGLGFTDYWEVVRPNNVPGSPRDGQTFTVGDIQIRTFRTRHYPEQATTWKDAMYSIGLVIDERVIFSGDTQFDPDLLPVVEPSGGAETIFHDVQFFPGGIHASLEQLADLPEKYRSRIHLTHYGDNFEDKLGDINSHGFRGLVREQVIYEFENGDVRTDR
jgi:ribonuclease BN (tRNA processing enzyme)